VRQSEDGAAPQLRSRGSGTHVPTSALRCSHELLVDMSALQPDLVAGSLTAAPAHAPMSVRQLHSSSKLVDVDCDLPPGQPAAGLCVYGAGRLCIDKGGTRLLPADRTQPTVFLDWSCE